MKNKQTTKLLAAYSFLLSLPTFPSQQMQSLKRESGVKLVDLVGEDGKIYHGRMRSAGSLRLPAAPGGKQ